MEYLKVKQDNSFSKSIQDTIKVISFNPKNVIIYGSNAYKSSLYSSDIDLLEEVVINAPNKIEACKKIAKQFFRLITKSFYNDNSYLGEIKAGFYTKYYDILQQIGEIKNDKLIGYDYDKVKELITNTYYTSPQLYLINKKVIADAKLTELQTKYLLRTHSREQIMPFVKKNITIEEWLDLYEQIRLDATIRWTYNDVNFGKAYYDNTKNKVVYIPLWKALAEHEAPFKIDMIFDINNRFVEVTNFFALYYIDKKKKKHTINGIVFNIPKFITSLKGQIRELTQSKEKNFLKAIKRITAIARLEKDLPVLKKLVPIANSNIGLIGQVVSDIKVLKDLFNRVSSLPIESIRYEIDNFKNRLANVYEFKFNELDIDNLIDLIVKHKFGKVKKTNVRYLNKMLDKILDKIGNIINTQVIRKLKEYNFYPIPLKYLT